jgi:ribosomal protein S18 acetylase RimI-like enzyme
MSEFRAPIPLTAATVRPDSAEFDMICKWPYADAFVRRILKSDIPQRHAFGNCRIFLYHDPNKQPVGFGTIDVCRDHSALVAGNQHPHIPLLAVNPTIKSLGYGSSILQHLISEAAILARFKICSDILFLEVYSDAIKPRKLYDAAGFLPVTDDIFDVDEDKTFIVMAKRVSTTSAS